MRLLTTLSRAVLLATGLHVAALSCPSVAWAQSAQPAPAPAAPVVPAGDAIYLKNGGILRGTIIDAIPNDRARIQLATHEIATVSWADISRIEHADGTKQTISAPPAATGGTTDSGPKPLPADKSLVWVHIEGSDDANLEQDTTGQDDWAVVCNAPCDRQVSTAFWYRINGGGMKASKQFSLQGTPGQHETIRVTPASSGWFVAGVIAMPVGGVVAIYGLLFALVGSLTSSVSSSCTGSSSGNCTGSNNSTQVGNNIAAVGWTMVVVGLGLGITGIVVVVNNWKTGATQELGDAKASALNSAWKQVPMPTWQEATPLTRALPPAIAAPIFSGSF